MEISKIKVIPSNSLFFISALVMETPMDAYCVCFYWTVATMTSTGYGDIYAINVKEMSKFGSIVLDV